MGRMRGPQILVRTMSVASPIGSGDLWQYHSRSDRHSKVACWATLFDLLRHCPLLVDRAKKGLVGFGINHEMTDFKQDRKKRFDLVVCTPGSGKAKGTTSTFRALAEDYEIVLDKAERKALAELVDVPIVPVGSVQIALEAKACMTEHVKAKPRLHDELNSSHLTIHGDTEKAIAVGFVMVNLADEFVSPGRQTGRKRDVLNHHRQPDVTEQVIQRVKDLPRRSDPEGHGFDALSIVVIDCGNDGSPVKLVTKPPAPPAGDTFHYDQMLHRLANLYGARFPH
jgi:hypothetical protein